MRWVVLVAWMLAACEDSRWRVDVGELYPGRDPSFEVPASASPKVPFFVRVVTRGGGCSEFDSTDVDAGPDGALITPYDRYYTPRENEGCIAILVPIMHEEMVVFATTGTKTIRIRTRRVWSSAGQRFEELVDTPFYVVVE